MASPSILCFAATVLSLRFSADFPPHKVFARIWRWLLQRSGAMQNSDFAQLLDWSWWSWQPQLGQTFILLLRREGRCKFPKLLFISGIYNLQACLGGARLPRFLSSIFECSPQILCNPVHPFIKAKELLEHGCNYDDVPISSKRTARLDVPRAILDVLQTHALRDLSSSHSAL